MKARVGFIFCLSLCNVSLHAAWFGYDRGVAVARQGDLAAAQTLLTEELTARPDNVELLYDAGVAAYKKNDYAQAHAYFSKVVGHTPAEQPLHRQALFNLGDAYAGDKKLHEALQAFEQLLKLEPKNERAQHNRDVIKKMLEQKQNEDSKKSDDKNEQKKDQQQNKKDSQQNKSDQNGSDEQKQDGKKDSSQGDQGSQGQQGGQKESHSSSGDQDKKQQKQGSEGQVGDEHNDYKDRYGDNASGRQEEKDDAKKMRDKAGDKKDGGEQQSDEKQGNAAHDNAAQETAGLHKEQGQKGKKSMHAAWVDKVLDAAQKNDEALNKMLVHRAVAGNLGGRDGERCW